MSLETLGQEAAPRPSHTSLLADPAPSLLADYLAARMAAENGEAPLAELREGLPWNLRPRLPRVGNGALKLFISHKVVDSYPLIFTTLALAHPN